MKNLINKFLEARTTQEVNSIVNDNIEELNNDPKMFKFARNARKRIARLRREVKTSWKIYELN